MNAFQKNRISELLSQVERLDAMSGDAGELRPLPEGLAPPMPVGDDGQPLFEPPLDADGLRPFGT
jgi:hypothetical protein